MIWTVDRDWMPRIRSLASQAEAQGAEVRRILSVEELAKFEI